MAVIDGKLSLAAIAALVQKNGLEWALDEICSDVVEGDILSSHWMMAQAGEAADVEFLRDLFNALAAQRESDARIAIEVGTRRHLETAAEIAARIRESGV